MGWTSGYRTQQEIIDEVTSNTGGAKVVAHHLNRINEKVSHLWVVFEAFTPDRFKFIYLFLIEETGRNNWAYKDIDECMGPVELDCPLEFLELASPPANDYSKNWREEVRARHVETI